MPVGFKTHAVGRVKTRLHLSLEDIGKLIDSDQVVLLGREARTNREHKLFYSLKDNDWFVVVHDVKTNEVITIFHHTYHNRWKISNEALELARINALGNTTKHGLPIARQATPLLLRISCRVRTQRKTFEDIGLDEVPLEAFGTLSMREAVRTELFRNLVRSAILQKVDSSKQPMTIYVRAGKFGRRVGIKIESMGIQIGTLFPGGIPDIID